MPRSFETEPNFPRPIPFDELVEHAGWLRGLAASLVRDPGRADDLVQDTWLAALQHPPLGGAPARPWLERVFRNLARNGRRAERARDERERGALSPGQGPSPASIAEEVEAQRLLAEAVGRLADPGRTIVVLRYFRGLDASVIGRELALPAGTVRWRLKLALEELRRDLDRRFEGGRKAWSLVLARVLAETVPPALPLSLGWLAAAAVLATLCVVGWRQLRAPAEPGEPVRAAVASARSEESNAPAPDLAARDAATTPESSPASARLPLEALTPPRRRAKSGLELTGSVLVDGRPPRGPIPLEVILGGGLRRRLSTDEAGRFAVFTNGPEVSFALSAPGYLVEGGASPVWGPLTGVTPCLDLVVELRTPPAIRGRVVTPDGAPVPGARGTCRLRASAGELETDTGRKELACEPDGRFELTLLPVMKAGMPKFREGDACRATMLFEMPRIGRRLLELAPFAPADVDLGDVVLEPVRVCSFVVRDEHGQPLSAAVARLDDHWLTKPSSPTNREGRGELRLLPDGPARVRFSALGFADRVLAVAVGDEPDVWLEPVGLLEVQLEPPADTYGTFPEVWLTARERLFEASDAPRWELALDVDVIQAELGNALNAGRQPHRDEDGWLHGGRFRTDSGGKALISALRADVPFTLEVRESTGTVLARRELVLTPGERRRIALPFGQ